MRSGIAIGLLLWAALVAAAPPGHVVRAARERFERANRLYNEGRYAEALHLYQAAYDLVPSPTFLFNLALAREKTFDYEGCALAMQQFLRDARDAAERERATSRLEHCRTRAQIPVKISSWPPSAAIYVGEGRSRTLRGRTPARLDLAPGTYALSVEMPGYQPQRQQVVAEIGTHPEVDFSLEKLSSLRIEADVAGAQAQINDGPSEDAPVHRELPAGLYRIRVARTGHRPVTREVRVEAGQLVSLMLSLPPLPQRRSVTLVSPAPATVRVDGTTEGVTPLRLGLLAGRHAVEIRAPGFTPIATEVQVPDDADVVLRAHLEPTRGRWQKTAIVTLFGTALVALGAGVACGVKALDDQSTYDHAVPTRGLRDEGRAYARAADALWISGAALAAAGLVSVLLTRPRASSLAVER